MFVTKDRPGAGSENWQDRPIEDTASRMELKRSLRADEMVLQRLIEASLQGVLKVSGLGVIATDITERRRAKARRSINLCQDGGKLGR